MKKWLRVIYRSNIRLEEIGKVIHVALRDAIQTSTILKVINSQKSCSGKKIWEIAERQFTGNGGNSMATKKAMSKLELLILSSQKSVVDYITSFSSIIGTLEMAQSALALAQQIRSFIKGIADSSHQLVINKVRDMLTGRSAVTIQYCYDYLRSDSNWIAE